MSETNPLIINLGTGRVVLGCLRMHDGQLAFAIGHAKDSVQKSLGEQMSPDEVAGYDVIVRLSSPSDCRAMQSILSRIDAQMQADAQNARINAEKVRQEQAAIQRMLDRQDLSFGEAQSLMELGYAVSRKGFNKPHSITLQDPEFDEVSTQVYYVITTPSGDVVPWTASQCDLTKKDWYVLHTDTTA